MPWMISTWTSGTTSATVRRLWRSLAEPGPRLNRPSVPRPRPSGKLSLSCLRRCRCGTSPRCWVCPTSGWRKYAPRPVGADPLLVGDAEPLADDAGSERSTRPERGTDRLSPCWAPAVATTHAVSRAIAAVVVSHPPGTSASPPTPAAIRDLLPGGRPAPALTWSCRAPLWLRVVGCDCEDLASDRCTGALDARVAGEQGQTVSFGGGHIDRI